MATQHRSRIKGQLSEAQRGELTAGDRCRQWMEESFEENPLLSTVAVFGLGLGVGVVIGSLLAEPMTSSRRRTAETIGHRIIDSLSGALPHAVRERLS